MVPRTQRWWIGLALAGAACGDAPEVDLAPGVSAALAAHRSATLRDVTYQVTLDIPASREESIDGRVIVGFDLAEVGAPVVLDFQQAATRVRTVHMDGNVIEYETVNDHLVLPARVFAVGDNAVEIDFEAGDASLNRNDDFLYTLFVPDRARFALPVFDQPDLKARFTLELNVPASWRAVANGPARSYVIEADRARVTFGTTPPISTYLFAFAAGVFDMEVAERDGRTFRMFHRETDRARLERNRDAIFDLHARALTWLEDYTAIDYPFEKFDFVLVPSFQYGGMEHPGAILYRASSLLLDATATQNQQLGRASLIAHETAHMWFGDLVTMRWFDDVWTKEVFANFMAAKIVNPSFPEIDHDLRFFLAHYPSAYAVDRTAGTNAIRQPLDNLQEAGTLYGAIIYQKAPIVMRQLERLLGAETFREGMRAYLDRYRFGNATWPDLIAILDRRTDRDLVAWSAAWVEEPGRPEIVVEVETEGDHIRSLTLDQRDHDARVWPQVLDVAVADRAGLRYVSIDLATRTVAVPGVGAGPRPDFVLPGARGWGYGRFRLDDSSRAHLQRALPTMGEAALLRGVAWLTMWEAMLEGEVSPTWMLHALQDALARETDELNVQRLLGYLDSVYWRYTAPADRLAEAAEVERRLWRQLLRAQTPTLKAAYFAAYRDVALTDRAVDRLTRIWEGAERVPGVRLESERDLTRLATAIALRRPGVAARVLDRQLERIENPDRRARFRFVAPALSADSTERAAFFARLAEPGHRTREPWVLQGLSYLHHPLRAPEAERFIRPSLDLLESVQATGDIFFPLRWLDATLSGHASPAAAETVREFLRERPDLPPRLRGKLLQAADPLFRAVALLGTSPTG